MEVGCFIFAFLDGLVGKCLKCAEEEGIFLHTSGIEDHSYVVARGVVTLTPQFTSLGIPNDIAMTRGKRMLCPLGLMTVNSGIVCENGTMHNTEPERRALWS